LLLVRSLALPAAVLAGALLLAGCGSDSNDGGRPVPVGGDASSPTSSTPSTGSTEPSKEPSQPATPTKPTGSNNQLVVINPGNFTSNPAVQGLMRSYPLYFQALVTKDDTILKKEFPSFWYADTSQAILDAQRNGWVMRPPGGVVVLNVKTTKDDSVVVTTCRSQSTEYWDPTAKGWTVVAPKGSPEVIEMIRTGLGWMPYRLATTKGVNCAHVHYPV
jgi:predicted small secreted protein